MGKIKAKLEVKEGTTPRYFNPRSVPFAVREQIRKELEHLITGKILRKIDYSEWAAPIVPAKKTTGLA